jgi:hypothetical protein
MSLNCIDLKYKQLFRFRADGKIGRFDYVSFFWT